ncbi:Hypothetical predicted protein [Mytilus galloprovincialis]|uniref:Uncharacterized protein n=1 Tax=Mytilus galloprovincialis TaxID=29158 RepID=A0A8B6FZQ8_MYTGA|nr:Hypothetical predicted protein [Mytilus galloprovincialis]
MLLLNLSVIFTGNRHTIQGILEEDTTIEEYKLNKAEELENVCFERSGLVIHATQTFLAGSPDGLVSTSKGESDLKKSVTFQTYKSLASF